MGRAAVQAPPGRQRRAPLRGARPGTRALLLSPVQEFEIELEGSQTLRILCYEKRYHKARLAKEDSGERADRIAGKGQVQVRRPLLPVGSGGDPGPDPRTPPPVPRALSRPGTLRGWVGRQ